MVGVKAGLRLVLERAGLAESARALYSGEWLRFQRFKRAFGGALRPAAAPAAGARRALLVQGPESWLPVDLSLVKMLEVAGFRTVPLVLRDRSLGRYFGLTGADPAIFLEDFLPADDFLTQAAEAIAGCGSVTALLDYEFAGVRAGRFAVSTTLRSLRLGVLNLDDARDRAALTRELAECMRNAVASEAILRQVAPDCAVFQDVVYTRRGMLFDRCLAAGVPAIKWSPAHRSNALIFKRYTRANRSDHPLSLSAASWALARSMPWNEARRAELTRELERSYATGDWYGECATQFGKRAMSPDDIRAALGLDPAKKTAVIFAHIHWDAPHAWGENLLGDYERWFVETVRAACANDRVNWVIKIHPANVGKATKEGYQGAPAEVVALRTHVGPLPPHVTLIPADHAIRTLSLLQMMDYCLTVRGTIGIEAAVAGIPVLTAGTGRYDGLGFTIDSASPEAYLARVARIEDIPRLTAGQRELAERFAYCAFLMRSLPLTSVTLDFLDGYNAADDFSRSRITVADPRGWAQAPDVLAVSRWLNDPSNADLLAVS